MRHEAGTEAPGFEGLQDRTARRHHHVHFAAHQAHREPLRIGVVTRCDESLEVHAPGVDAGFVGPGPDGIDQAGRTADVHVRREADRTQQRGHVEPLALVRGMHPHAGAELLDQLPEERRLRP